MGVSGWVAVPHVRTSFKGESAVSGRIATLANRTVSLPCDLSGRPDTNTPVIVLWYRGNSPAPFYSYDLRTPGAAHHWSDETVLGRRAKFEVGLEPPSLTVTSIRPSDEAIYRCRVDYHSGPSSTSAVSLAVIIPPKPPVVTDEGGARLQGWAGPYLEGGSAVLTCKTLGGRPSPSLLWFRDGRVWEDAFKVDHRGQVRNLLHLDNLDRNMVGSVFTCRALNNNLTGPLDNVITVNMTLAPLTISLVKVIGAQDFVSAGVKEELECSTTGSRPSARISWWRNGRRIAKPNTQTVELENKTVSILSLTPKPSDHGVVLTCRVENMALPSSTLEESYKLNVYYIPKVNLTTGLGLNPGSIREGTDVFFECGIVANPKVYKITWTHRGEPIFQNVDDGVLISNQTLVLQRVGRERAGPYTCRATNLRGQGVSNIVHLAVRYAPVCARRQQMHYQVARHDTVNITCNVDAVPTNVTFTWRFNNTSGSLLEVGSGRAWERELKSVLPYTPAAPGDYGLLLCMASNSIGRQLEPCVINVTAAKPPELLEGCTIRNQTSESVLVTCRDATVALEDVALRTGTKTYSMEVLTSEDLALVSKVSNTTPFFEATGLHPGTAYTLRVGVTSFLGDSEPIILKAFTVKTAEKRMGISEPEDEDPKKVAGLSPIVAVVLGAVLALVLVTAATVAAALRLCPGRRRLGAPRLSTAESTLEEPQSSVKETTMTTASTTTVAASTASGTPYRVPEDRNPDIIPVKDECDYQLEELRVPPCQVMPTCQMGAPCQMGPPCQVGPPCHLGHQGQMTQGPPGPCRHSHAVTLPRGGSGFSGTMKWETTGDPRYRQQRPHHHHHHHHHHHPYHSLHPPASSSASSASPSSLHCPTSTLRYPRASSMAALPPPAGACEMTPGGPFSLPGPSLTTCGGSSVASTAVSSVGGGVVASKCGGGLMVPGGCPRTYATTAPAYPCPVTAYGGVGGGGGGSDASGIVVSSYGGGGSVQKALHKLPPNTSSGASVGCLTGSSSSSQLLNFYPPPPEEYSGNNSCDQGSSV